MKRDLAWSLFAIAVALLMFVVAAYAADSSPAPSAPSPAVTAQPVAVPHTGLRRPGPGDGPRPGMGELPRVLMVAAINPQAKNDPEVQMLLDKVIADMQVSQQDDAARLAAFKQLVQVARSGDDDGATKAMQDLNSATQKLRADAKQVSQDMQPLEKKVHALRPGDGGAPHAPSSPSPSER
jgi:hypothetical protein